MDQHERAHLARLAATTPRQAGVPDIAALTGLLTGAFADDPVMSWGFREGAGFKRALDTYFGFALKTQCAKHDAMYVAGEMQAAAVWLPPEGVDGLSVPLWRMVLMLPTLLRISGLARMTRVMAMGDAMEKHHPPEPPHWYLFFLGVAPELRGMGIGSAILEATLKRADAAAMPAYLDNSNPRNTRLYERAGFRVVSEYRPRKDCPPIWGMWRDARKA